MKKKCIKCETASLTAYPGEERSDKDHEDIVEKDDHHDGNQHPSFREDQVVQEHGDEGGA